MAPHCRTIPWLLPLAVAFFARGPSSYGQAQSPAPAPPPTTTRPADDPDAEFWAEPGDPPASAAAPLLKTAAEVRSLSPEEAAAARPVRIRGAVTYFSPAPPLLFVQDATGGVCVSGRLRELRPQLRPGVSLYGATVQVEGVTAAGGDIAHVVAPNREPLRVDVIEPGRLPFPRSATIAQLSTPALHGEQVEVEGVVRSVRAEPLGPNIPPAKVLTLAHGSARVDAVLFGRAGDAATSEQWVGAVVRARGVFNAATPEWHGAASMRLLLRSDRDLRVRFPADRAQELPFAAIRTLADAPPAASQPAAPAPTRVRVRGVVTLSVRGKGMFVQDTSGGVWVETLRPPAPRTPAARGAAEDDEPVEPRPGAQVEVVGFPGRREWSSVLSDASWAVTGSAPMPDAPLINADQALIPGMDARLVRVEAMVLSISRPAEYTTLVLQSAGRVFLARLADPAAGPPPNVGEGTWVRVTGVCVQGPAADTWAGSAAAPAAPATNAVGGAARPQSFHVMLPSVESVQVVRAPGWWTPQRVLVVCALLAAVALVAVSWVVALRRRVARQTHLIREHLAKRTLYEERVRIARDLHDSLEQDLLGITMQLNATEKLLTQPDRARQSLQLAAAMVRRSQAETHRAVWDLREGRSQDGLVPALREAVAAVAPVRADEGQGNGDAAAGPRVAVELVGEPRELPPQVENHVLRVAVEAVTNALKHAAANRIDVELIFAEGLVALRVGDDGRGFDAERLPPPSSGHFGLFGMRERAEKLNAALTIRSRPGGGTEIRLDVPTTANGAAATTETSANGPARAAGAVAP